MTAETSNARGERVLVPREVVDFLMGEGELQGIWFGDTPAGERRWWFWRKHLRHAKEATAPPPAAAQSAEIEALRAEVERLTLEMSCLQQQYDERTAYVIVHRGSALSCSDAVRSAYSDERRRADKLEEALLEARQMIRDLLPDMTFTKWDALLRDQEEGNG